MPAVMISFWNPYLLFALLASDAGSDFGSNVGFQDYIRESRRSSKEQCFRHHFRSQADARITFRPPGTHKQEPSLTMGTRRLKLRSCQVLIKLASIRKLVKIMGCVLGLLY